MKRSKAVFSLALTVTFVSAAVLAALILSPKKAERAAPPAPSSLPAAQATPVPALAGTTILVDAGHGGYDGGARCVDSGTWEKQLNLAVALQVEKSLAQRGATVLMTRREDVDLCDGDATTSTTKKRQDLSRRVAMARDGNADLLLSIHMNEYRARSESGPQVFYRAEHESSRLLAGCVQEALIAGLAPPKARAALAGDYFVLQLDIPSVLVECGFVSNPREEKLLLDEDYQARVAEAVADGVAEFLRLHDPDDGPNG